MPDGKEGTTKSIGLGEMRISNRRMHRNSGSWTGGRICSLFFWGISLSCIECIDYSHSWSSLLEKTIWNWNKKEDEDEDI